jgi:hypothetical protein
MKVEYKTLNKLTAWIISIRLNWPALPSDLTRTKEVVSHKSIISFYIVDIDEKIGLKTCRKAIGK